MEPVLYIAGDVHLRNGHGDFAIWLDELATKVPAHLVILGDLFDYWLETDDAVARYQPVLDRLRALGAAGWRLDLVRGNREAVAGRRLEAAGHLTLVWPALDVRLGGRTIRIVHGDRLCHDPGYRALASILNSFPFRWWQRLHPAAVQDSVARWMRRTSKGSRPQPAGKRGPFLDARRVVAAARGADVLVAGHIHEAWTRRIRGVEVWLVGDWPPGHGHWIVGFRDGTLRAQGDGGRV